MDLSALIFVALAVAWAAYLLPLALKHHHEVARSRTVDRFSHTMRVLARRDAVDKKGTTLVTPQPAPAAETTEPPAPTPAHLQARRAAAKRATKRRRNVLALLLVANVTLVALAAFAVVAWPYAAIPAGLLVAWLVACRLMVKGERKALRPAARMPAEPAEPEQGEQVEVPAGPSEEDDAIDPMVDTSAGISAIVDPAMWDPVPVTLPTYVGKPTATRSVRTIDLDATGVWTSGRTDADAQIAREADKADKAARRARRDGDERRATGS
ncbi:hypothetical protein GON03_15905 [Nocardioides sp. MAH-18]|uniref:Uncharacterized protein n=1 Tax=Nocardioides agri TaxID=2682843 RepID=A0A6L6XU09_9ACTN|nr:MULTISPECIES: hypothetical protein [unclassified Nocardioides]MBA2955820.1 hypothetical protein [Nocardioides sp. CGMCC 1.13656]MVQ50669.1 hypothetical protein [Nocardioides sp. MAH-18]